MRLADEKDPEVLRKAALLLEAENKRLTDRLVAVTQKLLALEGKDGRALQLELEELKRQLAQRNQQLFGRSTERRPAAPPDSMTAEKDAEPQRGHGPREQKELRAVELPIFTLDEPDKQCPKCGGALAEMTGQFEESEEITVVKREWVVQKIRRQKYRCGCGGCVETALGPLKLFPGARYSIDFAVEVAVAKYCDHLPLERQARIMSREGLVVDSQTLWDYLHALAGVLSPAHERLHAHVLAQPVIGADETTWPLLGKKGTDLHKTWQVWSAAAPGAVCYRIQDSRSEDAARELLKEFRGVLMADGFKGYSALAKSPGSAFLLVHCWAHVRRKFIEVEKTNPDEARVAIALIRELYEIEKTAPPGPAGDELRRSLRNERSRPIVERFKAFLETVNALPGGGLHKAVVYALGLWPGLVRFLEDPAIPLDNNATERSLRGVVIGRKNHYGSKSKRGTEVAALMYSVVESAKLSDVEPREYLRAATLAALRGEQIPLPHELAAYAA